MFCKHCGKELKENASFCTFCGKPSDTGTAPDQPRAQAAAEPIMPNHSAYGYAPIPPAPHAEPEKRLHPHLSNETISSMQGSILTFGILAIAFACTFVVSFMGIIFGAIALSKANNYISLMGQTTGRATVGRSLGKAGLIAGIAMTAFFVLYILLLVSAVCVTVSSPY